MSWRGRSDNNVRIANNDDRTRCSVAPALTILPKAPTLPPLTKVREDHMLSRRNLLASSIGAALAVPHLGTEVFAQQDWPARDIHSICMFPAGSGADILVRFYARKFQE